MTSINIKSIIAFIQSKGGSVSVSELVSFLAGSETVVCEKKILQRTWVKKTEVIEYLKTLKDKKIIYSSWDEGFEPHVIRTNKQAEELITKISSKKYKNNVEKRREYGCHGIKHLKLAEADGTKGWYIVFNNSTCSEDCQDIQIQIK